MVTELYHEQLANGVQECIEQRHFKPLLIKLIFEWTMDVWNKLREDIEKLFKGCVLNLNAA